MLTDPDVNGGPIVAEWVDLEPTQGVINFDAIDPAMAPWIAAHSRINHPLSRVVYRG